MDRKRSAEEAAAAISSNHDYNSEDERITNEIREGMRKALKHKQEKCKADDAQSPQERDRIIEEAFPKLLSTHDKAKELTGREFEVLRFSLREVVQGEVKQKMALLQNQLSEYHSILEDVIAFKKRCEQLEQDKKDLVSLCREVCQVRDDKIALLEKEVAQLRNQQRSGSSNSSSSSNNDNNNSDWVASIIGGVSEGSEGQTSQQCYHPQQHDPSRPPQQNEHQRQALSAAASQLIRHPYYSEGRRITLSPSSVQQARFQDHRGIPTRNNNSFNIGAIPPLPFQQRSRAPPIFYMPTIEGKGSSSSSNGSGSPARSSSSSESDERSPKPKRYKHPPSA